MKFKDLYRDVYSRLSLFDTGHGIYAQDIIVALNDAITQHRLEYVNNNMGQAFAIEVSSYATIESQEFPFAGYFTLPRQVIKSSPPENAIIAAIVWDTTEEIPDNISSGEIWDVATKDGKQYYCIADFDNVNTFDRTFKAANIRNYKRNNGLIYKKGDVVLDHETEAYYRCVEDFHAVVDEPIDNLLQFEKLYWYERGSAYKPAIFFPLDQLRSMKMYENFSSTYAFTVIGNKVYTVPSPERVSITYVPEWEPITDIESDVDIPDFMIPIIKNSAINVLGAKLGMNLVDQRIKEPEPTEEEDEQRR